MSQLPVCIIISFASLCREEDAIRLASVGCAQASGEGWDMERNGLTDAALELTGERCRESHKRAVLSPRHALGGCGEEAPAASPEHPADKSRSLERAAVHAAQAWAEPWGRRLWVSVWSPSPAAEGRVAASC